MSEPNATPIGGNKINTRPCDAAGQAKNWGKAADVLNPLIVNYNNTESPIEMPQGWVRFALTSAFTSQLATAHIYDGDWVDTGVEVTVFDIRDAYTGATGNEKGIALAVGSTPIYEVEILDFSMGGGGGPAGDDVLVATTALSSVADYLHNNMNNPGTYASGADLLVIQDVVGGSGTHQKERFAVDVSAVTGWHASQPRILGADAGVSSYFTISTLVGYFVGNDDFYDLVINIFDDYFGGEFPDKERLIAGVVTSDVEADDADIVLHSTYGLANGTEPTNPVTIRHIFSDKLKSGDLIFGVWSNALGDWVGFPNSKGKDGEAGAYTAEIEGEISPGSAAIPVSGNGTVYGFDPDGGGFVEVGYRTIYNPLGTTAKNSVTLNKIYSDPDNSENDIFLIMGLVQEIVPVCTEVELPTDVECTPEGIVVTTATFHLVTSINGFECEDE